MTFSDFTANFDDVNICSIGPDFDEDGDPSGDRYEDHTFLIWFIYFFHIFISPISRFFVFKLRAGISQYWPRGRIKKWPLKTTPSFRQSLKTLFLKRAPKARGNFYPYFEYFHGWKTKFRLLGQFLASARSHFEPGLGEISPPSPLSNQRCSSY